MKNKKRIFINDWLELKPYEKQTATDSYYLRICNDVKKAIVTTNILPLVLRKFFDNKAINVLSCFLTSYFEDMVSETNIWNSFVSIHKRLYKKPLPFYVSDEYHEKEINPQDISFLIWYFFNTFQEEKFITPYNDFFIKPAPKIKGVFDNAWESAPVNKHLKSLYQIDENENDYYIARNLIDTILFKTYLFYTDTTLKLLEKELEIINDLKNSNNIIMYLNENRDGALHKTRTRLLSLKGKEWAVEILGSDHPLNKYFLSMSQRISGFFLNKGQDRNNIFIEHIASGKKFNMTKKSFDNSASLKEIDTIMFLSIVQWKDEWWFSGISFQQPFDPDLVAKERNSIYNRATVSFLDHQKKKSDEFLKKQLSVFKTFNNGSIVKFLPSDRLEEFFKEYIEFFNASLKLSEKEMNEAKQMAENAGFVDTLDDPEDFSDVSETGLVFFNPQSGVEIALDVNSAFPLPTNPYYNEEESDEHVVRLLMDDSLSTELAMYCIDNCKTKLTFFKKDIGKKYLKDIDFLLRFWKKDNYHATPTITYLGEEKNADG